MHPLGTTVLVRPELKKSCVNRCKRIVRICPKRSQSPWQPPKKCCFSQIPLRISLFIFQTRNDTDWYKTAIFFHTFLPSMVTTVEMRVSILNPAASSLTIRSAMGLANPPDFCVRLQTREQISSLALILAAG